MSGNSQYKRTKHLTGAELTNSISPSIRQHGSNIGSELLDRRICFRSLKEPHVVAPSTNCNHYFGVGELGANGRYWNFGLERGRCVSHGESKNDMINASTICRVRRPGRMPSENNQQYKTDSIGGSHTHRRTSQSEH
jgi:hypothetical protein